MTFSEKLAFQWKDTANLILGVWLFLSPWILGFASEQAAAWNAWIIGVVIAVAALAALNAFQKWEEWVNAVLAGWLIISPWILGFAQLQYAVWNQVIVGLLVAILAIWSAVTTPETDRLVTRH